MPAAARPHCILRARDLGILAISSDRFWGRGGRLSAQARDDDDAQSFLMKKLRMILMLVVTIIGCFSGKGFPLDFLFQWKNNTPFFHLEKYFEIDFFLEISMENFHVFSMEMMEISIISMETSMENSLFDQLPLLLVLIHGFLALIKLFFLEILSILVLVLI